MGVFRVVSGNPSIFIFRNAEHKQFSALQGIWYTGTSLKVSSYIYLARLVLNLLSNFLDTLLAKLNVNLITGYNDTVFHCSLF